ncbi:MAG TPA: hypothetical protein VGD79_14030 [Thermoanaerobaculia bacterium]
MATSPEEVKERRRKRTYERAMALKGTIDLKIDIDELRGRNRLECGGSASAF